MSPTDWRVINQVCFSYLAVQGLFNLLVFEIVAGWVCGSWNPFPLTTSEFADHK